MNNTNTIECYSHKIKITEIDDGCLFNDKQEYHYSQIVKDLSNNKKYGDIISYDGSVIGYWKILNIVYMFYMIVDGKIVHEIMEMDEERAHELITKTKKELIETSGDVKWLITNRDGGGLKMVQQDTETVIDLYVDGIEYNYEIDNE